jgi:hypothetical protein
MHCASLSAMQALVLSFCSSDYDFAIASSLPHLTMRNLQVAMGFVGNYAPFGLSPQIDGMPVIHRSRRFFKKSYDLVNNFNIRIASYYYLFYFTKMNLSVMLYFCCFLLFSCSIIIVGGKMI